MEQSLNTNEFLLSIIIPVFNTARNIENTILTLISDDNFSDTQLLIVDDGSTDDLKLRILPYLEKYNNIFYKYQNNSGVSSARNVGIQLAVGKYLTFLDGDDKILPNLISLIFENIQTDCDIYFFNNYYINNEFTKFEFQMKKEITLKEIIEIMLSSKFCTVWNKIYRTNMIKKNNIMFKENIVIAEDLIFNIDYLNYVKSFYIVKKIYPYIYIDNLNGSKKYNSKYLYDKQRLFDYIAEKKYSCETMSKFYDSFIYSCLVFMSNALVAGDFITFNKFYTLQFISTLKKYRPKTIKYKICKILLFSKNRFMIKMLRYTIWK